MQSTSVRRFLQAETFSVVLIGMRIEGDTFSRAPFVFFLICLTD